MSSKQIHGRCFVAALLYATVAASSAARAPGTLGATREAVATRIVAPAAVVELVTVGPDHAIETRFGHILLRVIDPEADLDDAYDFGVAPFHRPGFIVDALMGRGMFRLRRSPTAERFDHYSAQDRQVESQRLNLTPSQTRRLLERLTWNLLPENVHYRYDHVIDNCSTRLRDLLDDVTDGALQKAAGEIADSITFRDEILVAGSGRLLALIGLDLVTGVHGEQRIGAWQRSFVPQQLREILAVAENPAMGKGTPLVAFTRVHHERQASPAVGGSVRTGRRAALATGLTLGFLLGVAGFAGRRSRARSPLRGRLVGLASGLIAALFGVLGVVLLPLSGFSLGHIWAPNLNAWLFVPFDLALLAPAVRWLRSGEPALTRWMRIYLNLRISLISLSLLGIFGTQDNGAFALAAASALLGLRAQPAKRARAGDA